MQIKFWGTRGSIPTAMTANELKHKMRQALTGAAGLDLTNLATVDRYLDRLPLQISGTVGGNTTCVEVRSGDQLLIIDAGSGLRPLGIELMSQSPVVGRLEVDFLISHTHWDHIQGFPFFAPAFNADNRLTFHSPFSDLEERLNRQQEATFFPVPTDYMSAEFRFNPLEPEQWHQIGNFRVKPIRLSHPGETYGYRIEDGNSCLVFASDSEYKRLDRASTEQIVAFFEDADLLIFDAQYSLTEVLDKPDWGHSSALMGAELAHRAGVRRLMLFHHDPTSCDDKVYQIQEEAESYLRRAYRDDQRCDVFVAYDGLTMEIP